MKIEPIIIHQEQDYANIRVDVSEVDTIRIYQDTDFIVLERENIQQLIDILTAELP